MNILNRILFFTLLLLSINSHSIEITPLLGYRGGGEFIDTDTEQKHTIVSSSVYGLIAGWPYGQGRDIEIYYSHQSSDLKSVNVSLPSTSQVVDLPLTIDYLHIGGTAPITEGKKFKSFVSGGFGFTYLSPDFSGLQSDLRASFSIGVGAKWPITNNVAFRLEARGLATLYNSNSALFCNGGCSLTVNGSMFLQGEVFAGVAFKF
jgi:opacity protein-like surface antigen